MENIGLIFNKTMLQKLHLSKHKDDKKLSLFDKDIHRLSRQIYKLNLNRYDLSLLDVKANGVSDAEQFDLRTTNPGMAIGLGYSHSTGESEQEYKMGFFFDFTTGLPILPGSSVKGQLRSFFPSRYSDEPKRNAVANRLLHILRDELAIFPFGVLKESPIVEWQKAILALEDIIFEGLTIDQQHLGVGVQDIFFDAFPSNAAAGNFVEANRSSKMPGLFLAEDSLAPHPHPLKDPTPLRFLKILPNVDFKFQFKLNDVGISKKEKIVLFKHLLVRFGVGAKSEVGYGKLIDPKLVIPLVSLGEGYLDFSPPPLAPAEDWADPETVKDGSKLQATILDYSPGSLKVRVHVKGYEFIYNVAGKADEVGTIWVSVQVSGTHKKGNMTLTVKRFYPRQ